MTGDVAVALPQDVIDAAITWTVRLAYNDPAPDHQRAFEQWLHADPVHAVAWERVGALRRPFTGLPPRLARATLEAANLKRGQRVLGRRRATKLLSLTGLILGAGWMVRDHAPWQRLVAQASTATGEQKTLHLPDGTTIVLNTDSAISSDMAGDRRVVVLHRGEMSITTGADTGVSARRPFWVATPFGKMQALGTRFTVRLADRRALVSVQEGAVALHPENGPPPLGAVYTVQTGESRWLDAAGTAPADLQGFTADSWLSGVVAGRNIRLGDLLAELSRYRTGRISCDDRIAGLRVSGLFHIRNTDQALQFLAETQPIRLTYRTRFWVSVGPGHAN